MHPAANNALLALLELGRRSRHAGSASELGFLLANDTHDLLPYRQAALWTKAAGVHTLSGVLKIEANAPYVQWLGAVLDHCGENLDAPAQIAADGLPDDLARHWNEWLPASACWLPLRDGIEGPVTAGVLFARDQPFSPADLALLAEWTDMWRLAWKAQNGRPAWSFALLKQRLSGVVRPQTDAGQPWWKTRVARIAIVAGVVLLLPVRLTVLAPAELVPVNPSLVRAPVDGLIESFAVQPNQKVRAGQPLFAFDLALVRSRLDVAKQEVLTAQAELRQATQAALVDPAARLQLSTLSGKLQEREAQAAYIAQQLERTTVVAPVDGVVLLDEPSEWIGRPVTTGQTILRIATPDDVEVEAWIGIGDAIPLPQDAPLALHLNASPLSPVAATVRYMAFEPVERPGGDYAYRLRAAPDGKVAHRVGLKGTARISGRRVPLGYWIMRRPLAALRVWLGW